MKRKIALAMSLAMVLTAMPVNGLTAYAEDIIVEEADETCPHCSGREHGGWSSGKYCERA